MLFRDLRLEVVLGGIEARRCIDARVSAVLLVLCSKLGSIGRIARTAWVGSLSGISHCALEPIPVGRLVLVDSRLCLGLQVRDRKVGGIVPRVVSLWLVDLVELVLAWVDLCSSLLGGIAGNVPEEYNGVVDFMLVSSPREE